MEPSGIAATPCCSELREQAPVLLDATTRLRDNLHPQSAKLLPDVVRLRNCYYSNLLKEYNTLPIDIERALMHDYSATPQQRELQLGTEAHITVHQWIDQGGIAGAVVQAGSLKAIHERFCERLPPALLGVSNPETGEVRQVIPGAFRTRDVKARNHVPISPKAVPRFSDASPYTGDIVQILANLHRHPI